MNKDFTNTISYSRVLNPFEVRKTAEVVEAKMRMLGQLRKAGQIWGQIATDTNQVGKVSAVLPETKKAEIFVAHVVPVAEIA